MSIPILSTERIWECPRCLVASMTTEPRPHTQFHVCQANGLRLPLIQRGVRAEVVLVEREDYVGTEKVQLSPEGRPVMAAVTKRNDGQDVAVYAPTASNRKE